MKEVITRIGEVDVVDKYANEGMLLVKPLLDPQGEYIYNDQRYQLIGSEHVCPVTGVDKTKWKEVSSIPEFAIKYGYVFDPLPIIEEEEVLIDAE